MAKDVLWKAPPDIRQNYDHTCWAAVMEAFCKSSPGRPKLDQEQIFVQYKHVALPDESMDHKGMHRFLSDIRWGLGCVEVTTHVFSSDPAFLYLKLKAGNVIMGYWESRIGVDGGWHVGLAYGLTGRTVHYLNPDNDIGGLLRDDLSYFGRKGPLVVGWRKW
jgi:hypothetical protein